MSNPSSTKPATEPSMAAICQAYRLGRIKFTKPGGRGLLESLSEPAIAAALRLHARVITDKQTTGGSPPCQSL